MAELFLSIVNMSISACWLVLAVLLLRLVLKKAPKWIICLLWGFAGLRLVMPFSLESIFSLIPSAETVSPEIMTATSPSVNTGIPALNNTINPVISESFAPEIGASANPLQILVPIAAAVWLVGIAVLLIYTLVSFLRLKKKIGTAVLLRDNIYQSENVASPFVLGIIKPKIYLPFNMSEQDTLLVIAHENAHIKRKDHLWKPLGFLILTLHWFNPLVWLGYVLLCRDIELACDERVVKGLDNVQRADYSQALLTCSVNRRSVAACPLAFGEVSVKDRVKSALSYKKPAFWVVVVAVVASAAVAVCFLTNPKKDKEYYDSGYSLQIVDETYIGTTQLPEKTDTYYFDVSNGTKGKLSNGARFEITMCNLQQGKLTVKLSGTALYSTTEAEPAVIKEIVVEEFTDGVVLTDKQYTHFYTFSFVRTQSPDETEEATTQEHVHDIEDCNCGADFTLDDMPMRYMYYSLTYPHAQLVEDKEAYDKWYDEIVVTDDMDEMLLVTFVKQFNIPKEDFEKANEEWIKFITDVRGRTPVIPPFDTAHEAELCEVPNADVIYTFDNEFIKEYYKRENANVTLEIPTTSGEEHLVGAPEWTEDDDYFGVRAYKYRCNYYSVPYQFIMLVGKDAYDEWEDSFYGDDFYESEEMHMVSFIKHFNISREDFDKANEENIRVLGLSDDRVIYPPYEYPENLESYRYEDELNEVYDADLIYTFDNEKINAYYARPPQIIIEDGTNALGETVKPRTQPAE